MVEANVCVTCLYNYTDNTDSCLMLLDQLSINCIELAFKDGNFKIEPTDLIQRLKCDVAVDNLRIEESVQILGELKVCEVCINETPFKITENIIQLTNIEKTNVIVKGWYTINMIKKCDSIIHCSSITINGMSTTYGIFEVPVPSKTKNVPSSSESDSSSESESEEVVSSTKSAKKRLSTIMEAVLLLSENKSWVAHLSAVKPADISPLTTHNAPQKLLDATSTLICLQQLFINANKKKK